MAFGEVWATKSEGVGLIVRALSFQDFQPRPICGHDPPTSRTDRRRAIAMPRFAL